jgi:hypothetical protein
MLMVPRPWRKQKCVGPFFKLEAVKGLWSFLDHQHEHLKQQQQQHWLSPPFIQIKQGPRMISNLLDAEESNEWVFRQSAKCSF